MSIGIKRICKCTKCSSFFSLSLLLLPFLRILWICVWSERTFTGQFRANTTRKHNISYIEHCHHAQLSPFIYLYRSLISLLPSNADQSQKLQLAFLTFSNVIILIFQNAEKKHTAQMGINPAWKEIVGKLIRKDRIPRNM